MNITKLNLGGGDKWKRDNWLNLDQNINQYRLEEKLLKDIDSNSIEKIFFSHALEHLLPDKARQLLIETYRILKPGGIIRIVVPDCEKFIKAYLNKEESFYKDNIHLSKHFNSLKDTIIEMGGNKNDFNAESQIGHYFFWDQYSLTWLLLCANYENIVIQNFGKSLDKEMTEIATMDSESGMPINGFDNPLTEPISIYIEALKPF